MRRPMVAGNWKMHGSQATNQALLAELESYVRPEWPIDITVFPPYVYLADAVRALEDGRIQVGATVDGPSSPGDFAGLGAVTGMRSCAHGSYGAFNNAAAAYQDNVVAYPSVEPSLDYSAISLLAFGFGAAGLG